MSGRINGVNDYALRWLDYGEEVIFFQVMVSVGAASFCVAR
jgi:hypothetical protein